MIDVHCVVCDGELMVVPLHPPLHPVSHGPVVPSPFASAHLLGLTCDHFVFICDSSLQLWDAKYYICQDHIKIDSGPTVKVYSVGLGVVLALWCGLLVGMECVYMWFTGRYGVCVHVVYW